MFLHSYDVSCFSSDEHDVHIHTGCGYGIKHGSTMRVVNHYMELKVAALHVAQSYCQQAVFAQTVQLVNIQIRSVGMQRT